MPLDLNYYYGNEADQFSFYRIPKTLLTDPRYKGITIEAKVLYGLLLDRMGLSVKNGWMDHDGRVYIYFTQEDAMQTMDCGHNKAVKLFGDLERSGLIERRKQGQGRPTRIYVKNFIQSPPSDQTEPEPTQPPEDFQTSDNGKSEPAFSASGEAQTSEKGKSALPKSDGLDFPKKDTNKTDKNKTEFSDTDLSPYPPPPAPPVSAPMGRTKQGMRMDEMERYRELIKENIEFDWPVEEHPYDEETLVGYVELMVEVCCSRQDFIRLNKENIAVGVVKSQFLKLNRDHIDYVRECMNNTTTVIKNIRAYTLAALYNAPKTMNQYYASRVSHDMAELDEGC